MIIMSASLPIGSSLFRIHPKSFAGLVHITSTTYGRNSALLTPSEKRRNSCFDPGGREDVGKIIQPHCLGLQRRRSGLIRPVRYGAIPDPPSTGFHVGGFRKGGSHKLRRLHGLLLIDLFRKYEEMGCGFGIDHGSRPLIPAPFLGLPDDICTI